MHNPHDPHTSYGAGYNLPPAYDENAPTQSHNYVDRNEEDWALDDIVASDDENATSQYRRAAAPDGALPIPVHPAHDIPRTLCRLPLPVIIPQRRPGTKSRGFIRAYAPVLEDSGVDQETFLVFLGDLQSALQAGPVFQVVQLTAGIAGLYPNLMTSLIMQTVQVTAAVAGEMKERWQGNRFLEEANRRVFAPRGLYAMIVTYKRSPGQQMKIGSKTVDLGARAEAQYAPADLGQGSQARRRGEGPSPEPAQGSAAWKEKMRRLRSSSGQTVGDAEMPIECAPLIFPAIEHAAEEAVQSEGGPGNGSGSSAGMLSKAQSASKWFADYFDRRAQAAFARKNPDSTLARLGQGQGQRQEQEHQSSSESEDPDSRTNEHAYSNETDETRPLGDRRRWEKAQKKAAKRQAKGEKAHRKAERKEHKKEAKRQARGVKDKKPRKRLLTADVLYLMIVNMPTAEELEEARQVLRRERERKEESSRY